MIKVIWVFCWKYHLVVLVQCDRDRSTSENRLCAESRTFTFIEDHISGYNDFLRDWVIASPAFDFFRIAQEDASHGVWLQ